MRQIKYLFAIVMSIIMLMICYIAVTNTNKDNNNILPETTDFSSFHIVQNTDSPRHTANNTDTPQISISPSIEPTNKVEYNKTTKPQSTNNKETSAPKETEKVSTTLKPTKTPTKTPIVEQTKTPTKSPTKKPVKTSKPVNPTIYTPKASGSLVYKSDDGESVIDVSNKSKGYFAAKYSGNNKKVKVQVKANSETYNYDLPSDGKYVFFPLQLGNGNYSITIYENVSGTQYTSALSKTISVSVSNTNNIYLYPNQYVWFTQSSNVVTKSAQVCNGKTKDIDKISAIFKYVTNNISYDYDKASSVKSGYLPNVDNILSSKKGICFDYAALFAAMCRAQGIPTKLVTGYVSPNGVYHAWNEVYTSEKGWITVSFYLNKIGFNLVDSTFYSNMGDEEAASEYIGNGSNYQKYHIY